MVRRTFVVTAAVGLLWAAGAAGQGIYVPTAGPVHRGMGGASTAAPVSAAGALYWNPATAAGLEDQLDVGLDILFIDHTVSSAVPTPAGVLSGSTEADAGTFPLPNVGLTVRVPDSRVTLGAGIHAVAGFKTTLAADPTNPVLAPPAFGGLGAVASEASFLHVTPVVAVDVTPDLAVAAGPVISTAQIQVDPFAFAAPDADGAYPNGRATRYHWGGGAQAGVYYTPGEHWRFGAAVKTPVWYEDFESRAEDAAGLPRTLTLDLDLPTILTLGAAWAGPQCGPLAGTLLAVDVRYFDYADADGFGGDGTFAADGSLRDPGWESVWAVAAGAQRALTDDLTVRAGYSYNESPIADGDSFVNTASPLIFEHTLNAGGSVRLTDGLIANAAYSYFPEASVSGPAVVPGFGPVPGSSVTNETSAHALSFGFTALF